jgi:hypothetical protein
LPVTRRNTQALADGFSAYADASLKRAVAIDAYAQDLSQELGGERAYAAYKTIVEFSAGQHLNAISKGATGLLPSPGTIEDLAKDKLACDVWADAEVIGKVSRER